MSPLCAQPGDDREDRGGGAVGDGELVVAGGQSTPLFGLVEGPLDDVAPLVGLGVEPVGSTALAAAPLSCGDLVALGRDDGGDAAPA